MSTIHYLGEYSLAVELLEKAHKADINNIATSEMLYIAYYCNVSVVGVDEWIGRF